MVEIYDLPFANTEAGLRFYRGARDKLKAVPGQFEKLAPMHGTETRMAKLLGDVTKLPPYDVATRQPGDIFIFYDPASGTIGHCNMTAKDITFKIDSVQQQGVRRVPISNKRTALVYRFSGGGMGSQRIAQAAALLAEGWAQKVGYADGESIKVMGYPMRALGAGFGSSEFGKGAQGRLAKYAGREDKSPKNVICSEMCILAYQLTMTSDRHPGFIKLDAKHSTPVKLVEYFEGPGNGHWKKVAYLR